MYRFTPVGRYTGTTAENVLHAVRVWGKAVALLRYQRHFSNHSPLGCCGPQKPSISKAFSRNLCAGLRGKLGKPLSGEPVFSKPMCFAI